MSAPAPNVLEVLRSHVEQFFAKLADDLVALFAPPTVVTSSTPEGGSVTGGEGPGSTELPSSGGSAPDPAAPDNDPEGGRATETDGSGTADAAAAAEGASGAPEAPTPAEDLDGGVGTAQAPVGDSAETPEAVTDPRTLEPPFDPAAAVSAPGAVVDPRLLEVPAPPEG